MTILTDVKITKGLYDEESILTGVILTLTCTDSEDSSNTKNFTFPWLAVSDETGDLTWDNLEDYGILADDYNYFLDICIRECRLLWGADTAVEVDISRGDP